MAILQAKNLTLDDVHHLLGFQPQLDDVTFFSLLSLESLTEFELQELHQTQSDLRHYLASGKVSEGQVKFLVVAPLMRLAGFYKAPIEIALEEDIGRIAIADEDIEIAGRYDILATKKAISPDEVSLWILVIESKKFGIETLMGLPQLLTYASKSLEQQSSVWGLTTNGLRYQFVYLQAGNSPTYPMLPSLSLLESEPSVQLLQVLKAICKL